MIAGLEDISGGEVRIGGKLVNDVEPADRGTAMVFQSYALYPHMTVEENLSFGLRMNGNDKADTARRVAKAGEILQITPLMRRRPRQLSGGQRQRVAIGRAIVREPRGLPVRRAALATSTPSSGCRCGSSWRGCTPSSA